MTQVQPQTQGATLFEELQLHVDQLSEVNEFALRKLEREADKLARVDAAEASVLKAGISALKWDFEETNYWVKNALALNRSTDILINTAVCKGLIGDFSTAADLALEAHSKVPLSEDTAFRACGALLFSSRYEEALEVGFGFRKVSPQFEDLIDRAARALAGIERAGLTQQEVQRQAKVGAKVAADNRVRIKAVHSFAVDDSEDEPRFVVALNVLGNVHTEIALDEALVSEFLDDPLWNPMKLSVEFFYLTPDELLS